MIACRRYARWVAAGFNPVHRDITSKQRWPTIFIRRRKLSASKMEKKPLGSWRLEVGKLGVGGWLLVVSCWLLVVSYEEFKMRKLRI